ncbi:MAG: 16S rRNA (guanine(966)-N(2))-methyltransferase RsmD [Syntrophus sp. (in: bacteria)]|nr:16S rRNA (guanine(966)-N(2))-methyltransferase RsmD [Syntrophus sp. (in: bacteria)]
MKKKDVAMNNLRITGGSLRNRAIGIAPGNDARYTSSKVREALFNIIGDVEEKHILDLFAGSGSFSIEALSRGAASATCVENDPKRVTILQDNLEALSLNSYCQVLDMDVRYAVPFLCSKGALYDIIFMDPPYEKGYLTEIMIILEKNVIYGRDTMMIMEYSKRETIAFPDFQKIVPVKTKRYGDTTIMILNIESTTRGF